MEYIDPATFLFLCELKTKNVYWYMVLEQAGYDSVKLTKKCLEDCDRLLKPLGISAKGVNPFTVSKAANCGDFTKIGDLIRSNAWEVYRNTLIKRIHDRQSSY